jgi:hypothetical protein
VGNIVTREGITENRSSDCGPKFDKMSNWCIIRE